MNDEETTFNVTVTTRGLQLMLYACNTALERWPGGDALDQTDLQNLRDCLFAAHLDHIYESQ